MRFLLDQDVYAVTARLLQEWGHDVVTARELGLSRAADVRLLRVARELLRIFVTRDRDFGALVFVEGNRGGVIYLRMSPSTQGAVHNELMRVLTLYSEHELRDSFVVVEPGRHRIRRLSDGQQPASSP
jgi:predicted nuclease of predicted toxin-antitoxin system